MMGLNAKQKVKMSNEKCAYCPNCHIKLPKERNFITEGMHILNQCYNCKARLWDDAGKFLGKIVR